MHYVICSHFDLNPIFVCVKYLMFHHEQLWKVTYNIQNL